MLQYPRCRSRRQCRVPGPTVGADERQYAAGERYFSEPGQPEHAERTVAAAARASSPPQHNEYARRRRPRPTPTTTQPAPRANNAAAAAGEQRYNNAIIPQPAGSGAGIPPHSGTPQRPSQTATATRPDDLDGLRQMPTTRTPKSTTGDRPDTAAVDAAILAQQSPAPTPPTPLPLRFPRRTPTTPPATPTSGSPHASRCRAAAAIAASSQRLRRRPGLRPGQRRPATPTIRRRQSTAKTRSPSPLSRSVPARKRRDAGAVMPRP